MSASTRKSRKPKEPARAMLFAALGDETRLALVARLAEGETASIAELSQGARISRQAITKHLRVLELAGIVHSERAGRETRFVLNRRSLHDLQVYLDRVSKQWDEALDRLKTFVEK